MRGLGGVIVGDRQISASTSLIPIPMKRQNKTGLNLKKFENIDREKLTENRNANIRRFPFIIDYWRSIVQKDFTRYT
jgi:hypothetical protein